MVHCILLKFKEATLTEDAFNAIAGQLDDLEKRLGGLTNPQIYRNIVSGASNMDLMITLELEGREDLDAYLHSDDRKVLYDQLKEIIVQEITFDHA